MTIQEFALNLHKDFVVCLLDNIIPKKAEEKASISLQLRADLSAIHASLLHIANSVITIHIINFTELIITCNRNFSDIQGPAERYFRTFIHLSDKNAAQVTRRHWRSIFISLQNRIQLLQLYRIPLQLHPWCTV